MSHCSNILNMSAGYTLDWWVSRNNAGMITHRLLISVFCSWINLF
jgi:hypothetical protein